MVDEVELVGRRKFGCHGLCSRSVILPEDQTGLMVIPAGCGGGAPLPFYSGNMK